MKKVDRSIMFWYGMAHNGKNRYPAVTIASRYNPEDGTVNRGIAICNPNDNPSKAEGRKQALKRLWLAEARQMNCSDINWSEYSNVSKSGYAEITDIPHWEHKAQYHQKPERIELRVFCNPNK